MTQEKSYLQRLSFDANLNNGIITSYLKNFRLTILLILIIIIGGIVNYTNLPQRLNPEIKIPVVTVTTILPGASPKDIETLITIPFENQINTITGIDTMSSISSNNTSTITIQFVSQIDPKKAEQEIKSAIAKVTSLPQNTQTPIIKAFDFDDQPVLTIAIATSQDPASLMRLSERLASKIEETKFIERVEKSGFEEQEIQIIISLEKIRALNINIQSIITAIKYAIQAFPAGTVNTNANTLTVTINPQIKTIEDIRNIRITTQGKIITLQEIATIARKPKEDQPQAFLTSKEKEPQRIVIMNIYKTKQADINKTVKEIKKITKKEIENTENRFTVTTINDTSEKIRKQFVDLLDEFQTTIFLVFLCLMIFVGIRQAIISSITIPLTFLATFLLMPFFQMTINFLTLFAFLLALGLLIDDTIVIISAMTTYYKTGKFTPFQTGRLVWKDYIIPIWSTTFTTIWAFIPLLLASGVIGEFIKPIPIIISLMMISSTAIAILITLPLMIIILQPQIPHRVKKLIQILFFIGVIILLTALSPKKILTPFIIISYFILLYVLINIKKPLTKTLAQANLQQSIAKKIINKIKKLTDKPIINLEYIANKYKNILRNILLSQSASKKTITAVLIFAIASYALLPLGLIKNEFFPKSDSENLYINIEYPPGTNINTLTEKTKEVLNELRQYEEFEFIKTEIGKPVQIGSSSTERGTNNVAYTIKLVNRKNRKDDSQTIAQRLRKKFEQYTQGKVSIQEQTQGPPAGADIQIELSGDNLTTLDEYAQKITTYLNTRNGITNINTSLKPGPSQIVFEPDKNEITKNNITIDAIGYWLRLYVSGQEIDTIKSENGTSKEEKIKIKLNEEKINIEELERLSIPTQQATHIPITTLGQLKMQSSPTQITRKERKRTITISASVVPGKANITQEGKELEKYANTLNLPEGYLWKIGGVNEENAKSVQSIIQAMGIAFILILLTMVIQFGSFRQAFIALAVIPLAVSSVFFIFAISRTPLSFPALIGVLALFGIIVKNSMFIIDKINLNRKEGMPFLEAVADAGASRLEPILLTKLTTVVGLLPITISEPIWRGLGGAIIAGLLLSSTYMLLFIPVIYYLFFKNEQENKNKI